VVRFHTVLRPAESRFQRGCLSRYQMGWVAGQHLEHHEMSRT